MNEILKKYDKLLIIKKTLDGRHIIQRTSPIYKNTSYDVLEIKNQYIGSGRWIMSRLKTMDSRNNDFFISTIIKNEKLRKRKEDTRMSQEVAKFMQEGDKILI